MVSDAGRDITVVDDREVHLGVNDTGKACADGNIYVHPGAGSRVKTNAFLEVGPAETRCN